MFQFVSFLVEYLGIKFRDHKCYIELAQFYFQADVEDNGAGRLQSSGEIKDFLEISCTSFLSTTYLIIVTGTMGGARVKIFCQV